MASFNRVILVGNLTRDPELRYIPSGTAVCEVGLAVNDRRKSASGEWIEETTFVDVTLWSRTAEVASEYLSKGASVLIEGRLKLDTWEKDGKKNSKLRVVGEKMQMLGGKGGSGGGRGGAARGGAAQGGPSYDESEAGFSGESFDDSHGSPPPSKRESVGHGTPAPNDDLPF
ncbi:MAG TPA: single-stranded DNA-binding protein [Pirellulales bacterium]|jgi:single-strand DNA-binding protein|nr:single-stranded DNA-binding protein [Pirellulales bacterium]